MIIVYILVGVVSGIISGMGIGGGAILIPTLILVTNLSQHTVQSINLLYFIPTAIAALIFHIRNKNIEYNLLKGLIVGGIIGALVGALLANNLDSHVLRRIFGVFILIIGYKEITHKEKDCKEKEAKKESE